MALHQNPLSVIIRSLHVLHLSTLGDFKICSLSSLIEEEARIVLHMSARRSPAHRIAWLG